MPDDTGTLASIVISIAFYFILHETLMSDNLAFVQNLTEFLPFLFMVCVFFRTSNLRRSVSPVLPAHQFAHKCIDNRRICLALHRTHRLSHDEAHCLLFSCLEICD